jgi:hypothetical protein
MHFIPDFDIEDLQATGYFGGYFDPVTRFRDGIRKYSRVLPLKLVLK